jgi:protein gp37
MSDNSAIEWTEATWNPTTGCTRVSEGCRHCYIERTPPFRIGRRRFDSSHIGGTTGVMLHPERLEQPLRWRKPRRIFVNSLSDLFHEAVPDGYIARVWDVMAQCPQHTFQILTKRHARMRSWVTRWADTAGDADVESPDGLPPMPRGPGAVRAVYGSGRARLFADMLDAMGDPPPGCAYPLYDWMGGQRWWPPMLSNVWLGVSVEDQMWADIRIPALLDTPAAVRFLSCEPLLGPVDLRGWLSDPPWVDGDLWPPSNARERSFDWVIAGGESGPGARPMDLAWARSLVEQCQTAGVPVFVKQLGTMAGGKAHHDIGTFPPELRVRAFPVVAS